MTVKTDAFLLSAIKGIKIRRDVRQLGSTGQRKIKNVPANKNQIGFIISFLSP